MTSTALVPVPDHAPATDLVPVRDITASASLFGGFSVEAAQAAAKDALPTLFDEFLAKREANKGKVGIKAMTLSNKDMRSVSLFDLSVEADWNSRDMSNPDNIAWIEWLAGSIATHGVIEPLKVRYDGGILKIRNGHCRYFGAMLAVVKYGAKIESVPVVSVEAGTNKVDDLFLQALTNELKPFSPLETAGLYRKIMKMGVSALEIAKRLNKSLAHVDGTLRLLEADPETQALMSSGHVAATEVSALVRDVGPTRATEVLTEAKVEADAEAAEAGEDKSRVTRRHINRVLDRRTPAKTIAALRAALKPREDDGEETVPVNKALWARVQAEFERLAAA